MYNLISFLGIFVLMAIAGLFFTNRKKVGLRFRVLFVLIGLSCFLLFKVRSHAGAEEEKGLKVMILGVDGATWDVIVPMIAGKPYGESNTIVPSNLIEDGGFEKGPFGDLRQVHKHIVERPHTGRYALLLKGIGSSPAVSEEYNLNLSRCTGDRLKIEGWLRHPRHRGWATIQLKLGNKDYSTVRSFEIGPDWEPFRFQAVIPENCQQAELIIYPCRLSTKEECLSKESEVLIDDLKVQEVQRLRFPQTGFYRSQLASPENLLPGISRLLNKGSYGLLGTFDPNISPSLWTTVATGRLASKHGIPDFRTRVPGYNSPVLVNSTMRQVKALWNVIGKKNDHTVAFLDWWVTWPAEEVSGIMVSDHANVATRRVLLGAGYLTEEDVKKLESDPGLTYPPGLIKEILPLMVLPESITIDQAMEFADLSEEDKKQFPAISRMERKELSLLKFKIADLLGRSAVAEHIYTTKQPDLFAVYFSIVDAIEHYFWRWMEPEIFLPAPADRIKAFRETIYRVYARQDRIIDRLAQLADENTVIIILSDHGHRPVRLGSRSGKSGGHSASDPGIIILAGGPIHRGQVIEGATLLDIAPTVLYLMGYPTARNMPGRVLTEALNKDYLKAHPIRYVDTYEDEERKEIKALTSKDDERLIEQLRALGYIK